MHALQYVLCDVFTDRPLSGKPHVREAQNEVLRSGIQ